MSLAGTNPQTPLEINNAIGELLREFTTNREAVLRAQNWLIANDLKVAPYGMSAADEAQLKSAIQGLNTALQAVDMTVINRCTGLF